MLFNSLTYIIFLTIVLLLYFRLSHRLQNRMLLVASYIFYGWWDWRFLFLMLLSTTVDYFLGFEIDKCTQPLKRKQMLVISIFFNLGLLCFFKYFNFFIENIDVLLHNLGWSGLSSRLNIILPVGLSFYTFQSMSYTIDIYRKQFKPSKGFLDFALFVSFFPQLVAGPIGRARDLLPQVHRKRSINRDMWRDGIYLISWGLYKKIVIADNLAPLVDRVFEIIPEPSGMLVILATIAFAFQIYCDFSAYSDIARGTAKLMGFELMLNFNIPYMATNPSDFWKRWHISLSTWLRDYLYISLGGNRVGKIRNYLNLAITMILGGLWHGACWTFIFWGIYHGFLLIMHRLYVEYLKPSNSPQTNGIVYTVFCVFIMFIFTCFGWLLFRANSMDQVCRFTQSVFLRFEMNEEVLFYLKRIIFYIWPLLVMEACQLLKSDLKFVVHQKNNFLYLNYYLFIIIAIVTLGNFGANTFIYFQF